MGVSGISPSGVAVNPAGTFAYVANASGYVMVINTATKTVTAAIIVGTPLVGISIGPAPSISMTPIPPTALLVLTGMAFVFGWRKLRRGAIF